VLRLRRAVAAFRPHVVHLHSAKAGLAGRLAVRRRIPTVFQPHGWSWLAVTGPVAALTARWERAAVRWTDLVVCVGDGEADQAAAAGVAGRVAVVRNGVDLRRFRPATPEERGSVREAAGWGPDVPVAVCVGRVARQKGQDVLLRAWPQVLRSCPDAELVLVGGGEEELDLPGPPRVRAVGAVDDVRPWLSAADVVVFPSRWEGLSLGLLEAMAVGRSTVVSAIPGLVEVVDGSTGAAVPADDAAALAAAVVERLRSPELRASEGAAAAARAREEFSERATFDRLAVLTSALATGAVR
jgi:glycosyltransferase involved in cell wall biosynthesis